MGKLKLPRKKEFGRVDLFKKQSLLTNKFLKSKTSVWMSHEDAVVNLPKNLKLSHIPKFKIHNY